VLARRLVEDIGNTSDKSQFETVAAPGFAESTEHAHLADAAARPRDGPFLKTRCRPSA